MITGDHLILSAKSYGSGSGGAKGSPGLLQGEGGPGDVEYREDRCRLIFDSARVRGQTWGLPCLKLSRPEVCLAEARSWGEWLPCKSQVKINIPRFRYCAIRVMLIFANHGNKRD